MNEEICNDSVNRRLYTCSMHPQILEHHPGDCPICGMKLIKKNAKPVAIKNIDLETLLKPTNEFVVCVTSGYNTQQESDISIPVKAYGTIEADTRAAGTYLCKGFGADRKIVFALSFSKCKSRAKSNGNIFSLNY